MAAEDQAAAKGAEKGADVLKHKVGPLPLGVWLLIGVGVWWYVSKRSSGGGQQTDPAGNVGTIDPATGYVYGSTQDRAGLSGGGGGGDTGTNTGTPSGSTTAGAYQTNGQWGTAAINYLVGLGVDPAQANEAIQLYLSSQSLTTQQQGDVNLAIQALGAPPEPPGPVGTNPGQVVTPPDNAVYAANPPTGVTATGTGSSSIQVKWNATANATGYTVRYGKSSAASDGSVSVDSTLTSTTLGNLSPGTLYYVQVQGTPAKAGAGFGSASATTSSAPSSAPPPPPPPPSQKSYTVVHGDTLYGIAGKLHISESYLYNNNKSTIEATARSHGYPSSDNGHWIFPGEVLHY